MLAIVKQYAIFNRPDEGLFFGVNFGISKRLCKSSSQW